MDFKQLSRRALAIRNKYSELEKRKFGKEWTREQIAEGLVGDVGDLMKLVLAKSGVRTEEHIDEKLAHELADCLWSILVLAEKYNIDLEKSFVDAMSDIEKRLDSEVEAE